MAENFQSKYIQTNGIQLHAIEAGPQDGELVVLLHGFPEFWRGWSKQIPPLAEAGFLVVAPDQRGYNLSDKPAGVEAYNIDILAKDILGLLSVYNQKHAVIAGHDWGAGVAWHLATHYPEAVRQLIILNVPHPSVMVRFVTRSLKQFLKSWYIYFFQIPNFPEWALSRRNYQGMRRILTVSSKPGTFTGQDLAYYQEAWAQPGALTAMLNWYRAMFRAQMRRLGKASKKRDIRVKPPTLILWGVKDLALSRELVEPSMALCEDARLVLYEDATHWVQHEKASQVNQEILKFIRPMVR